MAIHRCTTCDRRFSRNSVGRPPKECTECGGPAGSVVLPGEVKRWEREQVQQVPEVVELDDERDEEMTITETEYCKHGKAILPNIPCPFCLDDWHEEAENDVEQAWAIDEDAEAQEKALVKPGQVADTSDAMAMLQQALTALAPKPAEIDEEKVRSIVNEAVGAEVANLRSQVDLARDAISSALVDLDLTVKRAVQEAGITRHEVYVNGAKKDLPETHHAILPEVITVLAVRRHVFLVGPAGSGKSTILMQAAETLGLPFYSLSLGPTTPTSKLFGYMDAMGNYVRTPFREAYEFGGIMLVDEMDNGHPGLTAELNQALANPVCAFADGMVARHKDFVMGATGNTFGRGPDRLFVGRNILDAATLDRFVTIEVPVDEAMERTIAMGMASEDSEAVVRRWVDYVQQVRARVTERSLAVVVSPRSTIDGALLLTAGMAWDRVKEVRLFAGIGNEVRSQVEG